jgi:hypothetical protein
MARPSPRSVLALVLAGASIAACATGSIETSARPAAATTSHALLTADEIRQTRFTNAYDAVQYLRPLFLSTRGPTSILNAPRNDIVVIVNGQVHGGLEELRTMPANGVLWIRHLSAAEVYLKVGHSAPSGGIEVRMAPCRVGCE